MRTLFLTCCVAAAASLAAADDTCAAMTDWRDWSACLWFPLDDLRGHLVDACDIKVDVEKMPSLPTIPNMPDKCGHCSMKARCRKRAKQDGCFPIELERQTCHEHGDICMMPKFPKYGLGCKYEFASLYLRQCANRADFPSWKSDGMREMSKIMPEFHCVESGDQCACCCHPYVPNEDGTSCVEHSPPECEPWSEWNDWSDECVWLPPLNMRRKYQEHCNFEVPVSKKSQAVYDKLATLPNGEEYPDKCGYCSYKIKCRGRDKMSAAGKKECWPLEVEKKNCGEDDCEGCSDVCDLPKMLGSCNFTESLHKLAGKGKGKRYKMMPMNMKMGLTKMAALLPHGKCVESGDRCKCCCHPYEPNEDGSECVLKNWCREGDDLDIDFDLNLPDETFFFF